MPPSPNASPKHIGIVAASPEGCALAYRELFRVASRLVGDRGHPRVTLHNEPLELYLDAVDNNDWNAVGELMTRSAKKLADAGAECVIAPENLLQPGVQLAEGRAPVRWLKMTDYVAEAVIADRRDSVGLIGTRKVMEGSVYQTLLGLKGIKVVSPEPNDAAMIDGIIFDELVHGTVNPLSRRKWQDAIQRLGSRGAKGVILACTEAPLLIGASESPLPVYDSTALLAEGAIRFALGLTR